MTERTRFYKWCILIFKHKVSDRECLVVDVFNIIKELKIDLRRPIEVTKQDDLEEFITNIFHHGNIIDIEYEDDEEANNSERVEVIHDDYNLINPTILDDISGDSRNTTNNSSSSETVSKLGLRNIFEQGHKKLVDMKIPAVRERKQNRMKHSQDFFSGA